jgi:hypothetical protein
MKKKKAQAIASIASEFRWLIEMVRDLDKRVEAIEESRDDVVPAYPHAEIARLRVALGKISFGASTEMTREEIEHIAEAALKMTFDEPRESDQ